MSTHWERRLVAVATAALMVFSLFLLLAGPAGAASNDNCTGVKYSVFTFNFVNGTTISGDNCPGSDYEFQDGNGKRKSQEAWFPGTGGSASFPNGPGMQLHVSCSDVFTSGWSDKQDRGPSQSNDPNWQIANYSIDKFGASGALTTSCGEVFVTTTTTEATTTTTEPTTTAPTTTTTAPTTTTVPDEVLSTYIGSTTTLVVSPTVETLPFTGAESGLPAALALVLIASGALALVGARVFRADADE